MTKERKLAIQMWINIRNMLSASDGQLSENISYFKEMFCVDHDLKWSNSCWFCQYISECGNKCPLKSCNFGSYYSIVVNKTLDKDVRVEACNHIIKALGGVI